MALAPALQRIAEGISKVGEWFAKLTPETQAFIGVAAALAVAAVIAGLAALGAAVAAVVIHWGDITAAIGRFVDAVLDLGPMVMDALKDLANQALEAARIIGHEIINGLKRGIQEKWADIKNYVHELAMQLPEWIRKPLGIQSPSRVFMEIGDHLMQGLVIGIQNGTAGAAEASKAAALAVSNGFGQAANVSALDQVKDKVDSITDSISRAALEGGRLRETFASILSTLGGDFLSAGLKGLGAALGIPGFATGTNFAPGGLALVGERGPELVNLPRGSQVVNANRTDRMLSGGGTVNNWHIDARGAQAGVGEEIRRALEGYGPTIDRRAVAAVSNAMKRGLTL